MRMNDPVPGLWYLNVGLPLHKTQRLFCVSVHRGRVKLVDDPQPSKWVKEHIVTLANFRIFYRACEDMSRAHVLGPCPSSCPTCFHPDIVLAVNRAIRVVRRRARAAS